MSSVTETAKEDVTMTIRIRRRRLAFAALVAIVVAVAAYGFTASNTISATSAGAGSGTISGYSVASVVYTLNATDPSKIDKVAFTLNSAASTVKAKVVASSTAYQDCTVSGGTSVSCDWPAASEPTVAAADQLTVIAVQ
jgi:hypothetical protein